VLENSFDFFLLYRPPAGRYITLAKFRYEAALSLIELSVERGLDESTLQALPDCSLKLVLVNELVMRE